MTALLPWVLSLLVLLQPSAPWGDTYEVTARGMIAGAAAEPVFAGPLGVERTIALDVSLAWFESRFDPHAVGDHGAAHGLYQVHAPEAEDARAQTVAANRMIRQSFKTCASLAPEERLAWYAAGGNDCTRGRRESRHRMLKAFWIVRAHPPPSQVD